MNRSDATNAARTAFYAHWDAIKGVHSDSARGDECWAVAADIIWRAAIEEAAVAADAMHAELLRQADTKMNAPAGSQDGRDLDRLTKLISDYEDVRWPMGD